MPRLQQTRRQLVGFVYNPQVQNDISVTQPARDLLYVQEQAFTANMRNGMRGRGSDNGTPLSGTGLDNTRGEGLGVAGGTFLDQVKAIVSKVNPFGQKGELINTVRNAIPDSDSTARPGFAGETHMILKLKNGKNGVANYMGPGTEVIKRVKRGDPGRTPSDTVAKRHDIDYVIAGNTRTTADQFKQIRKADNRMISSLKRIKASRTDAGRNITAGLRLIQAKTIGEDLGILDKQRFSGPLNKLTSGDSALLSSAKSELEQQGFGIELPGTRLKMMMLRKSLRQSDKKQKGGKINISKSSNGQSRRRGLGKSFKLNPKPLVGAGIHGGQADISKILKSKIIPDIVKSLGLPKSLVSSINRMIPKLVKMAKGSIPKTVSNIAKSILPLLVHKHLSGKGIKMSGRGAMEIVKKTGQRLKKMLGMAIFKGLKFHTLGQKGKSAKRTPQSGKGKMKGKFATRTPQSGKGFFDDFAKGFKSVFKPGAKILGAIATAAGQPEIGIPLSVVSGLL